MTWGPFPEALPFTMDTVEPQLVTPRVARHQYVLGVNSLCIIDGLLTLNDADRTASADE